MRVSGRSTLRRAVATLLLCTAALAVAVLSLYVHAQRFRDRGQGLFDEIMSLQVGVSTFADARKLADEFADRLIIPVQSACLSSANFMFA